VSNGPSAAPLAYAHKSGMQGESPQLIDAGKDACNSHLPSFWRPLFTAPAAPEPPRRWPHPSDERSARLPF